MKFHPNEIQRRSRTAAAVLFLTMVFLIGSFFRAQVLEHRSYLTQAEENRLREVPLPAPRGPIRDRRGQVIAENIPVHSVSILAPRLDSLQSVLRRIGSVTPLTPEQVAQAVRRFRQEARLPTVILPNASFDVVSRLEEHRLLFPGLIIQEQTKRFYPDGIAVAPLVGYTGEVTEAELGTDAFADYKPGQQVGKAGLERQYETELRGRDGYRMVEMDARGRIVRDGGAGSLVAPQAAQPLNTNIDLDLQRYVAAVFGDSLVGAAVAMIPTTGEVLALYSGPTFDPNRFIGGIPRSYYNQLLNDPRRPLYNKATQGRYAPGSTWKLATALTALELGLVGLEDRMPVPCTGAYQFGNRAFKCHLARGHGNVTLAQAIEQSCDVYFYQLGLRIGLDRLVQHSLRYGAHEISGIDLPGDNRSDYPTDPATEYFNRRYPRGGWSNAVVLNLSIGQGENSQTVVNLAKFYTALATDGVAATPRIRHGDPVRHRLYELDTTSLAGIRNALAGVVARGTAQASRIQGTVFAGKTGTAQSGRFAGGIELDHAWFAGFAPADDPKIVVAVMLEFGGHGTRAARIAKSIVEKYLRTRTTQINRAEGE